MNLTTNDFIVSLGTGWEFLFGRFVFFTQTFSQRLGIFLFVLFCDTFVSARRTNPALPVTPSDRLSRDLASGRRALALPSWPAALSCTSTPGRCACVRSKRYSPLKHTSPIAVSNSSEIHLCKHRCKLLVRNTKRKTVQHWKLNKNKKSEYNWEHEKRVNLSHLTCEHGSGITVNQYCPMTPTAQKTGNTM